MTVTCEWCGGDVDPSSTCPKSLPCPQCHVQPGQSCRRPSGHRAADLHASRVAAAEMYVHPPITAATLPGLGG